MSNMEFLYLCGAIVAFLAFASVLAWGEYQTRNIVRPEERDGAVPRKDRDLKQAA
jgi:hypothetical protein